MTHPEAPTTLFTLIAVWMTLDPTMHQMLSPCRSWVFSLGQLIATEHSREGWSKEKGHCRVEGALQNKEENTSLSEDVTVLMKERSVGMLPLPSLAASVCLHLSASSPPSLRPSTMVLTLALSPSISSKFISPKSIPLLQSPLETPALPSISKTN